MPVPALVRAPERDDDDVAGARIDLLVAARAAVGLRRRVRLDRPELGERSGERILDELPAAGTGHGFARGWHTGIIAPPARPGYNWGVAQRASPVVRLALRVPTAALLGTPGLGGALRDLAGALERSALDALVLAPPDDPASGDPYVVLGALGALTRRVALGCLATASDERHPAVLAKTVAALDVITSGRALALLGPARRGGDDAALAEGLEVLRAMLRVPAPSLTGAHFAIARAWNEPRARRATPTPVGCLVPPGRPDLLAAAARFAELTVCSSPPEPAGELAALAGEFRAACRLAGRLPGEAVLLGIVPVPAGARRPPLDRLDALRAAGFDGVVLDLARAPDPAALAALAATARAALAGG